MTMKWNHQNILMVKKKFIYTEIRMDDGNISNKMKKIKTRSEICGVCLDTDDSVVRINIVPDKCQLATDT